MRTDLKPGDVLLFKQPQNAGFWSFVGKAISFFEKAALYGGNAAYQHAAIVVDPSQNVGFETNPPSAHYIALSDQPWDRIDVYRPQVPVDLDKLKAFCKDHVGEPYAYGEIARFAGIGLLGMLNPEAAKNALQQPSSHHLDVCSELVDDALNAAAGKDCVPNVAEGNERPSDLAASPLLTLVLDGSSQA